MSESMRVSRCDTQTCEECGGQLLDDGTETVCDDCGLVADEDAGVSDYTVRRHWQRIQEAGIDGGQVDV